MKLPRLSTYALYALFWGGLGLLWGCVQTPAATGVDRRLSATEMSGERSLQTPAEHYAGEVLAYLMQVTLGKAGNPKLREEWGTRGLNLPLDYRAISDMMQGPEKDPRRVMVLDNNILGLSQVLYHYDKSLNLFRNGTVQESVFPCTELLALRVMLLQKMNRQEKVGLAELMRRKAQLLDPRVEAARIDLGGTRLQVSEMKLLMDVMQSRPSFMAYLEHPFVVDMLYRTGAVAMDPYVREKIQSAHYTASRLKPRREKSGQASVKIAVLPSMVSSFHYQSILTDTHPSGFMWDEVYSGAIENLQHTMLRLLQELVTVQMFGQTAAIDPIEQKNRHARVADFIEAHVDIMPMKQPLVVYPENAEKVIQDVCPDADFNVIVLGRNVYLSMYISEVDTFPHVNRVYLDMTDIRHGQADYEISQISMFVFNRLKPLLLLSQ